MGHRLLLATLVPRRPYSLAVRNQVASILEADDSFLEPSISRSLLFYEPICDYFLIGGAYSGYLTGNETRLNPEMGAEDDALEVTPELYQTFLASYAGQQVIWDNNSLAFVDLDEDEVNPDFIGRKWICVVDYHV